MHQRYTFSAALLLLVASIPLSIRAAPDDEPIQGGKRLSEWVKQISSGNREERQRAGEELARLKRRALAAVPTLLDAFLDTEAGRFNDEAGKAVIAQGSDAVPFLLQAVWGDDLRRRGAAIILLGRMKAKARPAIPSLLKVLEDREPTFQLLAIEALQELQARSAIPALLSLVKSRDDRVRRRALTAVVNLPIEADEIVPLLIQWLQGQDEAQRNLAVQTLEQLGSGASPAVADLIRALRDENRALRVAAVRCLGRIGPFARDAVPALTDALKQKKWVDALPEVAEALWRIARHRDAAPALKAWLKGKSGRPRDRVQAARLLWWMDRSPEAITVLADILRRGESEERQQALDALSRIGPDARAAVPVLASLVHEKNPYLRYKAIELLGRMGKDAKPALAALTKSLEDEDGMIRLAAALALGQIDRERTPFAVFTRALEDKNAGMRSTAALRLGTMGAAAVPTVPALTKALKDSKGFVRVDAAEALWRINRSRDARTTLLALLRDEDALVRANAATALGFWLRREDASIIDALAAHLWDEDSRVRSATAEALGRMGPSAEKAVPALIALLSGAEEDYVLSATAEALGQIGPKAQAAVPVLLSQLKHPDHYVRVCAAQSLWNIERNRSGLPVAMTSLHDRNTRARVVAAETLGRSGKSAEAVKILRNTLWAASVSDDPASNNIRYMVARALGRLGPAARAARPQLLDMLHDEDEILRATAAEAVKRIDASGIKPGKEGRKEGSAG